MGVNVKKETSMLTYFKKIEINIYKNWYFTPNINKITFYIAIIYLRYYYHRIIVVIILLYYYLFIYLENNFKTQWIFTDEVRNVRDIKIFKHYI